MALFKPRKAMGPRAVREWIGDVYVVDEGSAARKFYDSARAVWVGAGACSPEEREERLLVAPPRVRQERWAVHGGLNVNPA